MPILREHLHRFWFRFDVSAEQWPGYFALGCGVTAVDRRDAEELAVSALGAAGLLGGSLPPVREVVEDVDVGELDAGHVRPNMGDPSVRGVWFPRT
jgi:hypothetical protein